MMNYHDAVIQRIDISMVPGKWHVSLSVTVEGQGVVVTFEQIWWVGIHGLGMVINETKVISIEETGWYEVPTNCHCENGGYTVYAIQLSSGSKLVVVAQAIIENQLPRPT